MKPTAIIAGISAFSFASMAFGDVVVDITGATAFRSAAILAIKSRFDASGVAYQYSHDQAAGAFNTATPGGVRAIFKGTFPGVAGVTTIRTSFNGSVEGVRALVDSPASDPSYYTNVAGNFITPAAIGGGETHTATPLFAKTTATSQSEFAFSDVNKASTPYSGFSLQPSNAAVGVVVFTMLTNEGSTITNVTTQQFRALFKAGLQPLSLFTGNVADDTFVFATGRNDGSGTRTTYLAETGYGIANTVNQVVTNVSTSGALGTIQFVPAGGVNTPALAGQSTDNKSTVWSQNVDGNGGYSSGNTLRTDMGKTGTAVTVLGADGTDLFGGPVRADLVTFLTLSDAISARGSGAIFCSYNGVKLNDVAVSGSAMSAADKGKVTNGSYTAWGYQQLYRRNDITSGDAVTVYNALKTAIVLPANLGSTGVPILDMAVSRQLDGGVVAP